MACDPNTLEHGHDSSWPQRYLKVSGPPVLLGSGRVRELRQCAVLEEKRALIRRTGALAFTAIRIEHIGGYAPIRRLLRRAALTFSPEARAFGVEEAKGLLLVGLPGCGKDTIKKAASSVLGRALLDLDLGAVMSEGGGLIGSAGLSIKRALQIATTTKCVLGLGEYEKAVGGMQSSALSTAAPPVGSWARC